VHTTGKLCKGCVQEATSKVFIGSIPANYETVISKVDSLKSFGTTEPRFHSAKSVTPGPGSYFDDSTESVASEPFKHDGTSSMLSKTRRGFSVQRGNLMLGPGRYNTPDPFVYRRKEDTRYYAFNFERVYQSAARPSTEPLPGPGQYEVSRGFQTGPSRTYKSAFKQALHAPAHDPEAAETPGPTEYDCQKGLRKVARKYIFPERPPRPQGHLLQPEETRPPGPGQY
jgi:hypothetical protein